MEVSTSLELHGAAASSSPHSVIYLPQDNDNCTGKGAILYASNCIINIAQPILDDEGSDDSNAGSGAGAGALLYNVKETLRTQTLPRTDWIRSVTAMSLLSPQSQTRPQNNDTNLKVNVVACAFSDGSISLWTQIDNVWSEEVVKGLTAMGMKGEQENDGDEDEYGTSITDIGGAYSYSNANDNGNGKGKIRVILVSSSAKGVSSHHHSYEYHTHTSTNIPIHDSINDSNDLIYASTTSVIGNYPTSSLRISFCDNQLLLAVGTALPRNNRIHFYTHPNDDGNNNSSGSGSGGHEHEWRHQGSVMGHLDWVSCLDWTTFPTNHNNNKKEGEQKQAQAIMLASGSQDARIRLWRFHPSTTYNDDILPEDLDPDSDSDSDSDSDDEDLLEEGEARLYIRYTNGKGEEVQVAVTLEALLIGHEEHVTSVAWRPSPNHNHNHNSRNRAPCLMSSSMDRSILVWMEENNHHQADDNISAMKEGMGNVWVPITRVGTAGGILGGSIGSSLLGFVNVLFSDDGNHIIGHGFGGALHFWRCDDANNADGAEGEEKEELERWRAYPGITGHFRGVVDISWECTEGMYLLSVGADQTCRMWAPLPPLRGSSKNANTGICNRNQNKNAIAIAMVGSRRLSGTMWKEVGRPQVHGYDLTSVVCIGAGTSTGTGTGTGNNSGELLHRFVSGADETQARVFDAPMHTMRLFDLISGRQSKVESEGEVEGVDESTGIIRDSGRREERAFIPSLGLSNRATAAGAMEEGFETGVVPSTSTLISAAAAASTTNGEHPAHEEEVLSLEQVASSLPHERDLGVTSLWPEIRKLYGHLTEIVCLASTAGRVRYNGSENGNIDGHDNGRVLVASSCKAREAENAAIRIWDVERNMCLDVLKDGHKSTVVSMSFSSDGKYLASTGKDRRLCIWKRNNTNVDQDDGASSTNTTSGGTAANATNMFDLSTIVESAHKRIVWSVDFCPCKGNANILATGSRDGFLKIWSVTPGETHNSNSDCGVMVKELLRFIPANKGSKKAQPITAVAFAPKTIQLEVIRRSSENSISNSIGSGPDPDGLKMEHAIIAVGLETGLVELWAIPVVSDDDGGGSVSTSEYEYEAKLMHSIPTMDCHIDAVKKLAWRPVVAGADSDAENKRREVDSSSTMDTNANELESLNLELEFELDLTLASCSADHGVRIYRFTAQQTL